MVLHSSAVEEIAAACQIWAGYAAVHHDAPDPSALTARFEGLMAPAGELERRAVGFTLVMFGVRFADAIHHNFHSRFRFSDACGFAAPLLCPSHDSAGQLLSHESLAQWAERLQREFIAHHDSCAQRARRLLESPGGTGLSVEQLASRVAAGRRTLERQFVEEITLTVAEYRTRLRLRAAIRGLRAGRDKRQTVARDAGWGSKTGMYEACESVLGITPSDIQHLSDLDASCLGARLLDPRSLLSVRRCSRSARPS